MGARTATVARLGAALAGAAAVAACGRSTTPSGSPQQIVAAAPAATVAAGPAAITIDRFALHADGVVDLAKGAARLTVTQAGPGATPPTEVLVVGAGAWSRPVGSASWQAVAFDPGAPLSLPAGLVSGDVRAVVDLVRGASRVVVFGGLEVQQVSTVRYDAFCDPSAAAQAAGDATRPRLQALEALVDHPVRVDVYVDADKRIRRLEVPEDLRSPVPVTRPDGNRISATIDLVRFGVDGGDLTPPS